MIITKKIEWDMGHRIPNHKSVCRNLHGHRYILEVAFRGDILETSGTSDEGMVLDFGDIKKMLIKYIHEPCDHGFMFFTKDTVMSDFFDKNTEFKTIPVDFIPTAENIALWISTRLKKALAKKYGKRLILHSVKVWETPSSSAIISS